MNKFIQANRRVLSDISDTVTEIDQPSAIQLARSAAMLILAISWICGCVVGTVWLGKYLGMTPTSLSGLMLIILAAITGVAGAMYIAAVDNAMNAIEAQDKANGQG